MDLWGAFSTWEVINYDGAFFRAEDTNANAFNGARQEDAIKTHSTGGMSANAPGSLGFAIPSQDPKAQGNVTVRNRRGDTYLWACIHLPGHVVLNIYSLLFITFHFKLIYTVLYFLSFCF